MLSTTCKGVAAVATGGAEPPGAGSHSGRHGAPRLGQERRQGLGVQEWPDGSRYEGEFVNGFKHGKGRYSWRNGEYYEGSFYKDYRHGDGQYFWPTGHKFIGKFYLNRKEGYGQQVFPDGSTFHGLYHTDQRFGPGVLTYPDGRQDVGLWLGERLFRVCTSVEEGFSLKSFPEYAAYVGPSVFADSQTEPQVLSSSVETKTEAGSEVDTDGYLLADEDFILPPGLESYSTDGDHLPLPPGRRRELDRHFFGELWEPDAEPHRGYKRDPLSALPLQARMQAHIQKHRLQAENVGWDVAAVLSLNREGFGPKGHLEVSSEMLIQHSLRGELPSVSHILQTGLVHPDVADPRGHTALIAATVNCHNDVIQLLLDMGADIDKLNCEGMSALAVCHVLYYPFQSLHTTLPEPPDKNPGLRSPSSGENSAQISQVNTPVLNDRPQSTDTFLRSHTSQSYISDQTSEEVAEFISHRSSKVSNDGELIAERWLGPTAPETPAPNTDHLQEEEEEKETEGGDRVSEIEAEERSRTEHDKGEERETESRCDVAEESGESKGVGAEREFKNGEKEEDDVELAENREPGKDIVEEREEVEGEEEDEEEGNERGSEVVPSVERCIQVLDDHIALGSVQWKSGHAKDQDNEQQTFDSTCSLSSYRIQVTEEVMQHSAEALSHTGIPQSCDTQETVRKMAAMKIKHRVRLNTLKLLLERGADPNISRVPMPVLFLAIMAADTEAVRRLLLCGARTDIPLPSDKKGLYPLHVAAAVPGPAGPRITELLLHTIIDTDARACDQDEIYEPERMKVSEAPRTSEDPRLKEGGRTALHVACQRENDYQNASKVVALLLSHRAKTDLLWSGHSPLSLAITSGNDLAVEELLKGGADPSLPLGPRVGSALCALANIDNHLVGNRIKLLDMLTKAGADILVPVRVGDVVGTAVDFAHHSFNQDLRIANTPFHALNMREREVFKARRQLLSMMGDLLRQTAGQRERDSLERERHLTQNSAGGAEKAKKHRKPVFMFCYHCGRSASVKLTACSRCHKVYYCSRTCKLKAWDERHKDECVRTSASGDGCQKKVVFKSQRVPRPLTVMMKSKAQPPRSLRAKLNPHRVPKPMSMAENVLESQINLKENYSFN
ncbi:ankyrin repeat and MYND domain-containing protein 1 isoform X2 [Mugil cephalus]|uniref:ankyrin repeat and MYND domain-containing protein 1 isoform X2 n=1 Tax=Mugil cephalus TaxID=48193 RepID=UPI001FB63703|nr:ankyrin repeat and MYND domain-containing protein 1 isoform X2 [Mugil cephalus]